MNAQIKNKKIATGEQKKEIAPKSPFADRDDQLPVHKLSVIKKAERLGLRHLHSDQYLWNKHRHEND